LKHPEDKNDLAGKYKAWKNYCARPYKRYRNPGNTPEMNRESRAKSLATLKRLNKEVPLTSRVSDLIPVEIREKLNKIGL